MKKPLLLTLLLFITTFTAFSQFITTWKTDNAGTSQSDQIQLRINGTGYEIYWWLKSDSTGINGTEVASGDNFTLLLPQPGVYGVSISKGDGTLNFIRFNNTGDRLKLLEINQWGNNPWKSMYSAFYGCANLTISATDSPDLAQLSDLSSMFRACSNIERIPGIENWDVNNVTNMSNMFNTVTSFNQSIGQWDVSNVTNMAAMFLGATSFNQSISQWSVGKVTNMVGMFNTATSFNQSISQWDVNKVTDMTAMFYGATSFNQPLSGWDVSNVTNMQSMFSGATSFNQSISQWNVSNVTSMNNMFSRAFSFNQLIGQWVVSKVTNMNYMLYQATSFNQSISGWDLSNVTNMSFMMDLSGTDCANITYTLQGWAANPLTPNNITLGVSGINYATEANDALNILRTQKGWTISIGSEVVCQQLPVTLVHFKTVQQENTVRLNWATSLEEDHDYFEVQRSADSKNWLPLTRIQGSGNGNALHDYDYVDMLPLQATSYYRLKMVDLDGTTAYSTIRSVNRGNVSTVQVYPNPASASVTLSGLPKGLLKIYNRLGVLVSQKFIAPKETTFSVAQLPAGTYILKMDHGWQHQLVKVN